MKARSQTVSIDLVDHDFDVGELDNDAKRSHCLCNFIDCYLAIAIFVEQGERFP